MKWLTLFILSFVLSHAIKKGSAPEITWILSSSDRAYMYDAQFNNIGNVRIPPASSNEKYKAMGVVHAINEGKTFFLPDPAYNDFLEPSASLVSSTGEVGCLSVDRGRDVAVDGDYIWTTTGDAIDKLFVSECRGECSIVNEGECRIRPPGTFVGMHIESNVVYFIVKQSDKYVVVSHEYQINWCVFFIETPFEELNVIAEFNESECSVFGLDGNGEDTLYIGCSSDTEQRIVSIAKNGTTTNNELKTAVDLSEEGSEFYAFSKVIDEFPTDCVEPTAPPTFSVPTSESSSDQTRTIIIAIAIPGIVLLACLVLVCMYYLCVLLEKSRQQKYADVSAVRMQDEVWNDTAATDVDDEGIELSES
mmetsp:Transcript_26710/g.29775  ORF Transcript_26710/g.29775 Transcript_26710/m.29775 type:complete len:363 (+) Transcript_26710:89-1177(+)|eukprot:CAMPEP_0168522428 /NCGR_PEP_ID=MMETSP0405-20121227/9341_1 /TAXON_ID=498012 /ORGANISM="Trichosphaerium sp, Strain Am-I-7 wt" /LENGTH=362 /DNA_ID=CAMNT_0008544027 /DNA_START=110 /DNA_END=1198 /DNA_ORIENTATION=+